MKTLNGDYAPECADPFDFAALAVSHTVRAILEYADDPDLQVSGIFEEYISVLTERQTSSFKIFRNNHRLPHERKLQASNLVGNSDISMLFWSFGTSKMSWERLGN